MTIQNADPHNWMLPPMTASEAAEYGPQWGSLISNGDPGYIMYTAIPPARAEHRDEMVGYLRDKCLPLAEHYKAEGYDDCEDDPERLTQLIAYLEGLTY